MMTCSKCGTDDGVRFIEFGDGLAIPFCRRHVPLFAAIREMNEAFRDLGQSLKALGVAAGEAALKMVAPKKDGD